jgi:membrane-associated phospholipid phosphatase
MIIPLEHPRLQGYHPVDLITGAYLAITTILIAIGRTRIPGGTGYLLIHIGLVGIVALLRYLPRRGNVVFMFLRDTYPLIALPFFYGEMGILNRTIWSGFFDADVLVWEKAVFGLYPSVFLREWLKSPLLSEYLHFSYFGYYLLVPILGLWMYLKGRAEVTRVFATTMMLTFFTCYLLFIAFPVAGPRYVFAEPIPQTGFFAQLVHRVLASGSSRGTAFPSSHVAVSVAVLVMAIRFEKPLIPVIAPFTAGIFFGTVYCGFHYGVDAIAGLVLGGSISLIGPRIHSFVLRRARFRPLRFRFPHLAAPLRRNLVLFGRGRVERDSTRRVM